MKKVKVIFVLMMSLLLFVIGSGCGGKDLLQKDVKYYSVDDVEGGKYVNKESDYILFKDNNTGVYYHHSTVSELFSKEEKINDYLIYFNYTYEQEQKIVFCWEYKIEYSSYHTADKDVELSNNQFSVIENFLTDTWSGEMLYISENHSLT